MKGKGKPAMPKASAPASKEYVHNYARGIMHGLRDRMLGKQRPPKRGK